MCADPCWESLLWPHSAIPNPARMFSWELGFSPTSLFPDPAFRKPPSCGSSPWDAWDHTYRVFKTLSLDLPCGSPLSRTPLPQDHVRNALLRLNLVLLVWPDLIYCIGGNTYYWGAETFQAWITLDPELAQLAHCLVCVWEREGGVERECEVNLWFYYSGTIYLDYRDKVSY